MATRILRLMQVVLLCALTLGTGRAFAQIPAPNGTYTGCYGLLGVLRVINFPTQKCAIGETQVTWSQKGPVGPVGPIGPQGPVGPQGPAGPAGISACIPGGTCSVTKKTGCAYDANCALGETCTWAGPTPRFVDNGDGTVTDNRTCLMWEKMTGTVGTPNPSDPRDVNAVYDWSAVDPTSQSISPPYNFDGTAATGFLAVLNTTAFAGHTDWRLPTSAGSASDNPTGSDPELESILTGLSPTTCSSSALIDPAFGVTIPGYFWSSSTYGGDPRFAWAVLFCNGQLPYNIKGFTCYVRAVRNVQ